jgi:dTDP-4-dehydrorhamnose reductase
LFVTGGHGYLGRHILTGPASEGWNLIAPSSSSLDLRYRSSVDAVIGDWKPSAIIHTAYRRDDRASIVDASRNVALAADKHGAHLVHVSTDAVFAGRAWAYVESDPPTPVHQYGVDKTDAENAVLAACPGAVVVRTSLLIGQTHLSTHETEVRDAISGRSDVHFFTDEYRCPALVDDVAAVLVELAIRREITGRLHVAGPDLMSRAELAERIARRHDWDPRKLRFRTLEESGLTRPTRVELDSSLARSLGLGVRGPRSWE